MVCPLFNQNISQIIIWKFGIKTRQVVKKRSNSPINFKKNFKSTKMHRAFIAMIV